MLGKINPNIKEATIIGAGYAGLISAYRLLKAGFEVTLHEKSNRTGGLISTTETEYGLIESAAHSIRSSGPIINLFNDLDVGINENHSKTKFILRDGKLRKNPLTLWDMFTAGCYAAFKKSEGGYPSLAEWTKAHVGPGAVDRAMTPLAHGIYAAGPEELDQRLAFPRLTIPEGQTLVQKIFGNKEKADKSYILAPDKGMQELIDGLTRFIAGHPKARIIDNSDIEALPDAANIVVTAPAYIAGKLISSPALENLRYAPMVTSTVFVKKSEIDNLRGIGFLCARDDDQDILGILFNSSTFTERARSDYASLTVMMGGTSRPDALEKSDHEIETIIADALRRILGFRGTWLSVHTTRWHHAIPLYSKELRETLESLKSGWCAAPGHVLFGNYTGEVSIRGMCASSLALTTR